MSNFLWASPFRIFKGKKRDRDGFGQSAKTFRISPRASRRRLAFESLENRLVLNTGPIVTFHTSLGDFKLQLYSDVAPNTVANFLLYVNSGAYNNTIIHRTFDGGNAPAGNDIVQGGAVTTSNTAVPNLTTSTLLSERNLTNARGTIAMALSSFQSGPNIGQTNPDSASSSFFFNTANNNTGLNFNLDTQGFTVFGAVLGNGMTIVDAMAAATTSSNGGQPFVNGQPIVINSVVVNGNISGNVYGDLDSNNSKNGNDVSLSGVTVYVDQNNSGGFDSGDPSATTDANGNYTIVGVDPGTVTVREVNPPGWTPLNPPLTLSVVVTANQTSTGNDFPLFLDGPAVSLSTDTDSGPTDNVNDPTRHDGHTNFDNSTVAKAPKFIVSGVADGATVTLMDGNVQIGTGVGAGGSATITLDGNAPLSQGGHTISAIQTLSNAVGAAGPNYTLTIDSVAPQFNNPPPPLPTSVQAGTDVDYNVEATEEGDTGFKYSLVGPNPNPGINIDENTGQLTFHPDASQFGTYAVNVQATDRAGNVANLQFNLEVTNEPPTIEPIETQNVDQRGTLTVQVNATSPAGTSGDVLTYELVSPPNGASIDGQGLITWNLPNSIPPGITTITVKVTNASQQSSTESFDVDVAAVNHAPVVSPIADTTRPVGNQLSIQVNASDSDVPAQTLTYSFVGNANGATLSNTGLFSFTPTQAQNGQSLAFTIRVTDNGSPEALHADVTFHVAVNGTPIFTAIAPKQVNIGSQLDVSTTVTHVNAVTYNLGQGSPAGATIDQNGVFHWKPTTPPNAAGTFNITLLATDHVTNLTGSTVLQVTVIQPNRAPVISAIGNHSVLSGGTLALNVQATDPDSGQTLTYSLVNPAQGVTINGATGALTFQASTVNASVDTHVTVKVADNGSPSLSSTQTFKITTNPSASSNSTVRGYVGMGVDPLDSSGAAKALLVNGTGGADLIQLMPTNLGDSVIVVLNTVAKGTYSLTGLSRIVVTAFGGDDAIIVSKFKVGTIVDGGAGNDTIIGGIGNDVLIGNTGNDNIYAYGGAKIIIGGGGADVLHGGSGRNIIVGGTTNFDANFLALGVILDEWSTTENPVTAVAHLKGTLAGGQNGANVLTSATVHDDNAVDEIFGGGDAAFDWIFANLSSASAIDLVDGSLDA